MSMMLTFRARKVASLMVLLSLVAACSREQHDWRSAEAADTLEGYSQFLERHPDSELVRQARTRVAQLSEDREWQHASSKDTVDAYKQFLTQSPNSKWAQEARIRIQNFSLSGLPQTPAPPAPPQASPVPAPTVAATTPFYSGYGIQLGAFTSESAANNEWRQLTTRFGSDLGGLSAHVVPADTSTGRVFRLQAQVADESRARALCDVLRKQSQACVPVLPH